MQGLRLKILGVLLPQALAYCQPYHLGPPLTEIGSTMNSDAGKNLDAQYNHVRRSFLTWFAARDWERKIKCPPRKSFENGNGGACERDE